MTKHNRGFPLAVMFVNICHVHNGCAKVLNKAIESSQRPSSRLRPWHGQLCWRVSLGTPSPVSPQSARPSIYLLAICRQYTALVDVSLAFQQAALNSCLQSLCLSTVLALSRQYSTAPQHCSPPPVFTTSCPHCFSSDYYLTVGWTEFTKFCLPLQKQSQDWWEMLQLPGLQLRLYPNGSDLIRVRQSVRASSFHLKQLTISRKTRLF